jgi:hypothetical protein
MTRKLSIKDKAIKEALNNPKAVAKFMNRLEYREDGCINWMGYITDKGYGVFGTHTPELPAVAVKAHRFSYALHYGFNQLPKGTDTTQKRKVIHHKCENKSCVNALHLESVSDRFNLGLVNDKNMF